MALVDIVQNGIALADSITIKGKLQPTVQHAAWTGAQDLYGESPFDPPVSRFALVEQKQQLYQQSNGQSVMTKAKITFLRPIPPNGAPGRTEPIDTRDMFTLPDGTTGPIVGVEGFVDGETGLPYFGIVWLG